MVSKFWVDDLKPVVSQKKTTVEWRGDAEKDRRKIETEEGNPNNTRPQNKPLGSLFIQFVPNSK